MGFVYEDLPEEEWEKLKREYNLYSYGFGVNFELRNKEKDILILNLGGQDREEHPNEYVLLYKNTVSYFMVYTVLKGENKNIREKHILEIRMVLDMKEQEDFFKEMIKQALTVENDASNARFLKRNPMCNPYQITFIFEGGIRYGI